MNLRGLLIGAASAAWAVGLSGCSDDHRGDVTVSPTTSDRGSPTRSLGIPETVRIGRNIHAGRDESTSTPSRQVHRANLRGVCGAEPIDLDADALDRLGVQAPGSPSESRSLYLYANAKRADRHMVVMRDWLGGCDAVEEWGTTELRGSKLGDSSLLEVVTDVGTGAGPTGRWLRVIRVGKAILLTDSDVDASAGPVLEREIRRQAENLGPVLRDMQVFAAR